LDEDANFDVIVSSLSTYYVQIKLTKSQRNIIFVPLEPLLDADLGGAGCDMWAQQLIDRAKSQWSPVTNTKSKKGRAIMKNREYKIRMLKNAFRLYSGHPRSLEHFVANHPPEGACESSVGRAIIDCLVDDTSDSKALLVILSRYLEEYLAPLVWGGTGTSQIEMFVFSAKRFEVTNDDFRLALEGNKAMIFRKHDKNEFSCGVPGISTLCLVMKMTKDIARMGGPKSHAAFNLLKDLVLTQWDSNSPDASILDDDEGDDDGGGEDNDDDDVVEILRMSKLSTWFERAVALTVACRSYEGPVDFRSVFGVPESSKIKSFGVADFAVENLQVEDMYKIPMFKDTAPYGTLTVPATCNEGYDFKVNMGNKGTVYAEVKLGIPSRSLAAVLASSVCVAIAEQLSEDTKVSPNSTNNIADRDFPQYTDVKARLSRVYAFLYIWADLVDDMKISKDDVKSAVHDKVTKMFKLEKVSALSSRAEAFKNIVTHYLDDYFGNVIVIGRADIRNWLLPSLLAFPSLLSEVQNGDGNNGEKGGRG
jgi:hypothetical protein